MRTMKIMCPLQNWSRKTSKIVVLAVCYLWRVLVQLGGYDWQTSCLDLCPTRQCFVTVLGMIMSHLSSLRHQHLKVGISIFSRYVWIGWWLEFGYWRFSFVFFYTFYLPYSSRWSWVWTGVRIFRREWRFCFWAGPGFSCCREWSHFRVARGWRSLQGLNMDAPPSEWNSPSSIRIGSMVRYFFL